MSEDHWRINVCWFLLPGHLAVLDLFKIRGLLSYTAYMFKLKVDLKYILHYIDFLKVASVSLNVKIAYSLSPSFSPSPSFFIFSFAPPYKSYHLILGTLVISTSAMR